MKKWGIIAIIVGIVAVGIFLLIGFLDNSRRVEDNLPENNDINNNLISDETPEQNIPEWTAKGIAISGKYADAEIFNLGDKYRIYYSEEPEVAGFSGKVYSATSTNGITWTQESGTRKEWTTFASVIKLDNGEYRMYFQNDGRIKSAISSDGLLWSDESETRIEKSNEFGLNLDNVAAPTVIKTGDEYVMVYRGDINEKYPAEVPNSNTQLLMWATSSDGLTFTKKGIALDSRDDEFQGLLDGPEFVQWDDGSVRLYFWGYRGVYHVTFSNGIFSEEEFDFTTSTNPEEKFPMNPPGDPTLANINGKWFMYYGQHTKGIYYAVLE